ncbi:hypothetical protein [Microbacterium sp.]|uniref:hypothetical protein n=1 Tax=Microbacterium sp. TaxID=51671 RepID=UPI002B99E01B|nr:hypothetical protein [Microbacterium sp.]HWL79245.1 hypothetical protein [Microbacterium sp.]
MTGTEYADRARGRGTFPKHWRGLVEGQSSEERAATIVMNIAADHRARGNHDKAEATLLSYRTAGASNRSATIALARARRLAGH